MDEVDCLNKEADNEIKRLQPMRPWCTMAPAQDVEPLLAFCKGSSIFALSLLIASNRSSVGG
jgi:hypothetical protein